MNQEGLNLEYKKDYVEDIKKTVVAELKNIFRLDKIRQTYIVNYGIVILVNGDKHKLYIVDVNSLVKGGEKASLDKVLFSMMCFSKSRYPIYMCKSFVVLKEQG